MNTSTTQTVTSTERPRQEPRTNANASRKPLGGFCFITVPQLAMVWWAYSQGLIRLVDLRTWFACWELVSRRCALERGQKPRYSLTEVQRLTGGAGEEGIAASVRRLSAAGLLSWSEAEVSFSVGPDAIPGPLESYWEFLGEIENNRRKVPVPRRVVRFVAGGAGRVLTATILGHLFRCMYYRDGACAPVGNCRASWVAAVFGVGMPNVKSARAHLVKLGLFETVLMPQWHRNRWGARIAFNLAWSGPDAAARNGDEVATTNVSAVAESRPPQARFVTESRPPCLNQKLSPTSRTKNQKPTSGGPSGFSIRSGSEKPSLRHVVPSDLDDIARLLELWRQACAAGRAKASEDGRLHFVAMAEHARAYGSKNPCGLFAWLLSNTQWVTQADEDEANRRLKHHFFPPEKHSTARAAVAATVVQPTELARYVLAIQRVVTQQRLSIDPWHLARQHRPSLTREEWETGVAELENHRLLTARAKSGI